MADNIADEAAGAGRAAEATDAAGPAETDGYEVRNSWDAHQAKAVAFALGGAAVLVGCRFVPQGDADDRSPLMRLLVPVGEIALLPTALALVVWAVLIALQPALRTLVLRVDAEGIALGRGSTSFPPGDDLRVAWRDVSAVIVWKYPSRYGNFTMLSLVPAPGGTLPRFQRLFPNRAYPQGPPTRTHLSLAEDGPVDVARVADVVRRVAPQVSFLDYANGTAVVAPHEIPPGSVPDAP
ncbi:hypothetical protein [Yinghuangia seranimata]|uniref:hypothetical protein n=1 Tax=Yinghuangia seranimata TaxID=408067 RepID=UPI00248B0B1A|nr:hypothetical protein [Yinghuangia seranimata]MDI2132377.1 hypothetical protein [Yinghuangia seranimata]